MQTAILDHAAGSPLGIGTDRILRSQAAMPETALPHEFRPIQPGDDPAVAAIIRTVMPAFGAAGPGFAINDPEVDFMSRAYAGPRSEYRVVVDDAGLQSYKPLRPQPKLQCVFEYVYFARPDSVLWGRNVHTVRKALGHQLAREHPVTADLVIPVPDSGVPAAIGYAEAAGVPFEMGLIRSHYVGRTFIEPSQSIRHFGVRVKLNPVKSILDGRRVVLVDDSIVRGTTSRKIVRMVRSAGAT